MPGRKKLVIDVFVLIFLFIEALKRQPNFDNDKFKEDVRDFLEKAEFSNEKIKEAVSSRFLE